MEPTSDFYFDPKSKLYYCGKNGAYYCYDETQVPPFRRFVPPPPAVSFNESNDSSYGVSGVGPHHPAVQSQAPVESVITAGPVVPSTTTSNLANASAAGNKVTMGVKTAVGFGLIGTKNKKVKVDLAKWSALQQDDEEEGNEKDKGKGKEAVKEHSKTQEAKPSGAEKVVSKNETMNSPGFVQSQEPKVGSKRPLENSADAFLADFMATADVTTLLATKAPAAPSLTTFAALPPPPPGVRAPPMATPLPVAAAAISPAAGPAPTAAPVPRAPVCLLCQRQFPSFEMLQRHEKESKLHADNLNKSLRLV